LSEPFDLERVLSNSVFIRGANRPFSELTLDDVRARADELRAATGWGPTARVAPVARAWRELAIEMQHVQVTSVADLEPETLIRLAPQLWVVLPS
jgi:hypothetical protein